MSVTMSGKEFKAFFADGTVWVSNGMDWWMEEDSIFHNGVPWKGTPDIDVIADDAVMEIKNGYITCGYVGHEDISLQDAARRWLKKQKTITVTIELENGGEGIARLLSVVSEIGAKLIVSG